MPNPEGQALRLIELTYEAVADPARWPLLLKNLADAFNAHGGLLRQVDLATKEVSFSQTLGYGESYIQAYQEYYVRLDPYRDFLSRQPLGSVVIGDQVVPRAERLRSEYFNDYERPQDRIRVLSSTLARQDSKLTYLGLHRGEQSRAFSARDVRLIRLVLPHLTRAIQLQGLLAESRTRQALAEEALDRIRVGVILTDAGGRPFLINRAAETLMAETRALSVATDGLVHAKSAVTARLRKLIASAAAITAGEGVQGGGDMQMLGPDGATSLQVWVTPLARQHLDPHLPVPAQSAAVFLSRPGPISLPWQRVAGLYGLTPAEARLAVALSEGLSLEEAASRFGTTIHTLRSQLGSVFAKTGTSRQSELVAMVFSGVLALCRHEGEKE